MMAVASGDTEERSRGPERGEAAGGNRGAAADLAAKFPGERLLSRAAARNRSRP